MEVALSPEQAAAAVAAAGESEWSLVEGTGAERHGVAPGLVVTLLDRDGRLFRRRAVKRLGTPAAEKAELLVAELDGVRIYARAASAGRPAQIVVTRRDLQP